MVNKELRDCIYEFNKEAVFFDDPSFDNSIIGISDDGRVSYSLSNMIMEFCTDNNVSVEEAIDFIDYNTLRSLPYYRDILTPVVIDDTILLDFGDTDDRDSKR